MRPNIQIGEHENQDSPQGADTGAIGDHSSFLVHKSEISVQLQRVITLIGLINAHESYKHTHPNTHLSDSLGTASFNGSTWAAS
jgi:hypothetical protein